MHHRKGVIKDCPTNVTVPEFRFEVFHLPFINVKRLSLQQTQVFLQQFMPPNTCVAISAAYRKGKSVKAILCNSKKWRSALDTCAFPCCCEQLSGVLGEDCPRGKHLSVNMKETKMTETIPRNCHVESTCVPAYQKFCNEFGPILHRVCARIGLLFQNNVDQCFDHLMLFKKDVYWQHKNFVQCGVRSNDVRQWKNILDDCAVITPLEKCAGNLCIRCPLGYQQIMNRVVNKQGQIDRTMPDDLEDNVAELGRSVSYSGIPILQKHPFGSYDGWGKNSDPINKLRPLVSYATHSLKHVLGYACANLNDDLLPNVIAVSQMKRKFARFNSQTSAKVSAGWYGFQRTEKRDIDAFLNRVPHKLVFDTLCRLEKQWASFTRRIALPRRGLRRPNIGMKTWTRASKDHQKTSYEYWKMKPRNHTSKVVAFEYVVLSVKNFFHIAKFDVQNGFLFYGQHLVRVQLGLCQSNAISPGICNAANASIEATSLDMIAQNALVISRLHCRWVDDLFTSIVVWTPYIDDKSAHIHVWKAKRLVEGYFKKYQKHFPLET